MSRRADISITLRVGHEKGLQFIDQLGLMVSE